MLGTSTRLGKIAVGIFQARILIAMADRLRQGQVAIMMVFFAFYRAFAAVGIVL